LVLWRRRCCSARSTQAQSRRSSRAAWPPGVATKLIGVIQGLIIFFVGADVLFRMIYERFFKKPPGSPPATPLSAQPVMHPNDPVLTPTGSV